MKGTKISVDVVDDFILRECGIEIHDHLEFDSLLSTIIFFQGPGATLTPDKAWIEYLEEK